MAGEYVFVDEWDVDAPREAVFDVYTIHATNPAERHWSVRLPFGEGR